VIFIKLILIPVLIVVPAQMFARLKQFTLHNQKEKAPAPTGAFLFVV
jgi:hypothetical protein